MYFTKYVVLVLTCMMECKSIEAAALPSSTEGQGIVNEIIPLFENEHDGTSKGVTWTLVRQILQSVPVTERVEISSSLSGEPLSQLDLSEVDISSGEEVTGLDSQEAFQVHPSEDLEEVSNDIFEMIPKDRLHSDEQRRLISIDSNTIGNHTNFSFMHSNVVYWNDSHDISPEENSKVLNEVSFTLSDSSEEISSDIERSAVQTEEHLKGHEEKQFMRKAEEHTLSEAVDHPTGKVEVQTLSEAVDHPTGIVEEQPSSEAVDHPAGVVEEQPSSEAVDHPTGIFEEQPSSEAANHPTGIVDEQPSSEAADHPMGKVEEQPLSEEVHHPAGKADEHPSSESTDQLLSLLVADNQRNESVNINQSTELLQGFQGSVTTSDYSKDDFVGKFPENIFLHELDNSSNTVIKSNSSLSFELSSNSASSQSTKNEFQNTQNSELSEKKNYTLTSTLVDKENVATNNDFIILLPEVTVNYTEGLIQDEVTEVISTDKSSTFPECPEPGICLFWFLAQDTCSMDNHCLGSRICCKVRCSNTCVEI